MIRNPRFLAALLLAALPAEPEKPVEAPEGETFHGHLDKCRRCEGQPFNLCPVGAALLEKEGLAAQAELAAKAPVRTQT